MKKSKNCSPKQNIMALKRKMTSSSEIESVVNSESKSKKKKMKRKLNQGNRNDSSASDQQVITLDVKKKKWNVEPSDASAASDTTVGSSDVKKKKKKKKNKRNQGTSASNDNEIFTSKPLQQNSKSKHHKSEKKSLSIGKGSILEEQNETIMRSSGKPKFSKNKVESKLGNTQGKEQEKGTKKKRYRSPKENISRLMMFKNRMGSLLSKASDTEEKKKIESHIKKIDKQIQKLKSGLRNSTNKIETIELVNQRVFTGLPQEAPPAKKKNKRLELNEFLQNQLKASRFRWLNENLYTSSSEEAQAFFSEDPGSFKAYHEGYSEQVAKWPVNPVDVIITELRSMPKNTVVADLGCGEAKLAAGLRHMKVHSLDFIALKPEVTACDMAHCPLLRSSVDVAVFCLSLMGTNVSDFFLEANRILKTGGTMEIAEVESRFDSIDDFIAKVEKYGFQLKKKSPTDMFFFLTFKKTQDVGKSGKLPDIELKACVYKKR